MDNLNPVKLLLVEDNPADASLILDYFKKSEVNIIIKHVKDGAEALDCLYQRQDYKNEFLPDIIILDMNLPKIDGMDVLGTLKEDENLKNIPIIIFGTSNDPEEVKKAYKAQANCYIVKPIDYDRFNLVLSCIKNFWINIVKTPSKQE